MKTTRKTSSPNPPGFPAQNDEPASALGRAVALIATEQPSVEKALEELMDVDVSTTEGYAFAGGALKIVAARHSALDAKRKEWVEPLKRVAADIDATFRPVLKALKEAEEWLKGALGGQAVAQRIESSRLIREAGIAAQQGNDKRAEKLRAQAAALEPEAIEGVHVSAQWTGEVTAADLLPREYLVPDIAKLEAVTKATEGDPKIPGWRAFPAAAVRTTRKGA